MGAQDWADRTLQRRTGLRIGTTLQIASFCSRPPWLRCVCSQLSRQLGFHVTVAGAAR